MGWIKTGTAFDNQPTFGDNPTARNRGQPSNHQGDWWIGGSEDRPTIGTPAGQVQGDGPQGTLATPSFIIIGHLISFLIGGGCDINVVRAELIVDNQVSIGVLDRNMNDACLSLHIYLSQYIWQMSFRSISNRSQMMSNIARRKKWQTTHSRVPL